MGDFKLNVDSIELYFRFIERLDTETKKKWRAKLANSIEPKETPSKKRVTSNDLYGAWENSRTA